MKTCLFYVGIVLVAWLLGFCSGVVVILTQKYQGQEECEW